MVTELCLSVQCTFSALRYGLPKRTGVRFKIQKKSETSRTWRLTAGQNQKYRSTKERTAHLRHSPHVTRAIMSRVFAPDEGHNRNEQSVVSEEGKDVRSSKRRGVVLRRNGSRWRKEICVRGSERVIDFLSVARGLRSVLRCPPPPSR